MTGATTIATTATAAAGAVAEACGVFATVYFSTSRVYGERAGPVPRPFSFSRRVYTVAHSDPIVFPTDFSQISRNAVPWVKRMAAMLDAPVHCVYVVEQPQIYATLDMGPIPIPSGDELVSTARERLKAFVDTQLTGLSTVPSSAVLVGRPADEIVAYAGKQSAQLIVMTTHGYSGVKHVLLGSTTESVLRHAACPVLSIRSD